MQIECAPASEQFLPQLLVVMKELSLGGLEFPTQPLQLRIKPLVLLCV